MFSCDQFFLFCVFTLLLYLDNSFCLIYIGLLLIIMKLICELITRESQRCMPLLSRSRNYLVKLSKRTEMNVNSEGKTIVSFLSHAHPDRVLVLAYSELGFRLTNSVFVMGPVALFPKHIYSWNVKDATRVTPASTSLFYLLVPKVDLIVFGYGNDKMSIPLDTIMFLQSRGINSECLPTANAVGLYNELVAEGRHVAGALIPPYTIGNPNASVFQLTRGRALGDESKAGKIADAERYYVGEKSAKLYFDWKLGRITEEDYKREINELRKMVKTKTDF